MQSESTIQVLMVMQVTNHFLLVVNAEDRVYYASNVQGDDQTRHQKHRTTIVPRPVPIMRLQCLVKVHSRPKRILAMSGRRLLSLRHFWGADMCSGLRGLQPEQLVGAVFLLVAEVSETVLQALKLCLLL